MKFGVVRFPGSNCDQDAFHTIKDGLGQPVEYLWHQDRDLRGADCVVVPGGFSFGDYLRCGAIARFSPIMDSVIEFANKGGYVLGICNGFQVLCESHLLPGALVQNDSQKFICRHVNLHVANPNTPWTSRCADKPVLNIPVAHGEGKYVCSDDTYETLVRNKQIVFQYADSSGAITADTNVNGSRSSVAGIANETFNILGMMPHPERAADPALGSDDGRLLFLSLLQHFQ